MNREGHERMARDVLEQILDNWNEEPPPGLQRRVLARIQRHIANGIRLRTTMLSAAAVATLLILALPLNREAVSLNQASLYEPAPEIAEIQIAPEQPTPVFTSFPVVHTRIDPLPAPLTTIILRKAVEAQSWSETGSLNAPILPFQGFEEDTSSDIVTDFGIEPLRIEPSAVGPFRVALERSEDEESWIRGL